MPRWTSCVLVAVLGFSLAGCASNAETGFPDPSEVPTAPEGPVCSDAVDEPVELDGEITVLDNCYVPKVAEVAAGTEITWIQHGVAPHDVTFVEIDVDSHPDCSASATTECMADGDEFTATLDEPGEYLYYCVIHGSAAGAGMAATIVVE